MSSPDYTIKMADTGEETEERLFEPEWFDIFRSGMWLGRPVSWIEPTRDSSKRVTFAEWQDDPQK